MTEKQKTLTVFMADDHNLVMEAYKKVFSYNNSKLKNYDFNFHTVKNCKDGYDYLILSGDKTDLALLDISMPMYPEKNIMSGEDLAKLLQKINPKCKIILLTMHPESLKAMSIINEINPDGLIIKNDLNFKKLQKAVNAVLLENHNYYSESIIEYLNSIQTDKIFIDLLDKQIIHYLREGILPEDIPLHTPTSMQQVVDKIALMKSLLGIPNATEQEFLKTADEKNIFK
jgi:DNA-binding NarL/FixJ family response regulator